MVERADPREPGTTELEDPGTLRQKLDSDFLPRFDIAPDLKIRNREDVFDAFAANRDFDQRRSPFSVHRDYRGLTAMVPGDHRKGEPFCFRGNTGGGGDLGKKRGAACQNCDEKRHWPDPESLHERADCGSPSVLHLDTAHYHRVAQVFKRGGKRDFTKSEKAPMIT